MSRMRRIMFLVAVVVVMIFVVAVGHAQAATGPSPVSQEGADAQQNYGDADNPLLG